MFILNKLVILQVTHFKQVSLNFPTNFAPRYKKRPMYPGQKGNYDFCKIPSASQKPSKIELCDPISLQAIEAGGSNFAWYVIST